MKSIWMVLAAGLALLASGAEARGQLGWTSIKFCNGGDYCVEVYSQRDFVDLIRISHKGVEIPVPESYYKGLGVPTLSQTRLVVEQRADGRYENVLEIRLNVVGGLPATRKYLRIHIFDGKAYEQEVVAAPATLDEE